MLLAAFAALATVLTGVVAGATPAVARPVTARPHGLFPVGVPNSREPSGEAPPTANALPGYVRSYVTDFLGATLPPGWSRFAGPANGDADAYWGLGHVLMGGGMVRLLTYRKGSQWVSGGMCLCRHPLLYGAFFVRSRVSRAGPDEAELLWPKADVWPPEVDFNESGSLTETSWDVHYGSSQAFVQGKHRLDLSKWHTFGVIWSPTRLIFTVDGVIWGVVKARNVIPHQAMTLDIDQEARCNGTKWAACPTGTTSLQVDWVEQFSRG